MNDEPEATAARIGVQGPGVRDPGPFGTDELDPGEEQTFELPVDVAALHHPGSTR